MKTFKDLGSDKIYLGLAALIVFGLALIYFGKGPEMSVEGMSRPVQADAPEAFATKIGALEKELESKLQTNLALMEGVGRVQVSVSFATGLKSEYARNDNVTKNTSKETDKNGGTRETTQITENNQVVMASGSTQPVLVMEDRPEIAGILVIAEGAKDAKVREDIHLAVQTLLSIPGVKITVAPMGGGV